MAASLQQIEAMIDALGPTDQVRLLQHLLPRLTQALRTAESNLAGPDAPKSNGVHSDSVHSDAAWQEFRRVGERLAATSNGVPITPMISGMRRRLA